MSPAQSLADYVEALRAATDIRKPPPITPALIEKPEWHWEEVAETPDDQALERWMWGLVRFGRPVVVRAAAAMLGHMLPVWNDAVERGCPNLRPWLKKIQHGLDPSPQVLLAEIHAWLRAPSTAKAAELADATEGEERLDWFDVLWDYEVRTAWEEDPWMFVLTGSYAAAMTVWQDDDSLPRAIGNVAVCCRLALAPTVKGAGAIQVLHAIGAALTPD